MVRINIVSPNFKLLHLHKYYAFTTVIIICFSIFSPFVYSDNILQRWDQDIFNRIYDAPPHSEPLWTGMEITTEFGHYRAVMGFSILLMAYGNEDHRDTGRLVSSAYLGAGVVTYGMKHLIGRKRPLDDTLGSPAMPSGHTALAFSTATILACRYPKWRIPLYIGAGLVGFSRIYLGRHYTSDVLVGAGIGTTMGFLVWNNRMTILKWEF